MCHARITRILKSASSAFACIRVIRVPNYFGASAQTVVSSQASKSFFS